jgi:hypothetical protein
MGQKAFILLIVVIGSGIENVLMFFVLARFSALFLAPCFSRWVEAEDTPQPASAGLLGLGFSLLFWGSKAKAQSKKRAEACFGEYLLCLNPPAKAGGKEEPAEAG